MGFFNYLIGVILISAFYSLAITMVLYSLDNVPGVDLSVVDGYNNDSVKLDYHAASNDFQDSLQTQKNFSVVDLGALALYSGNIVADLAGNFIFAIPSMFSLLFTGIFILLPVNYFLQQQVILWLKAILSIITTIILITFLLSVRTQSLGGI